MDKVTLKLSRDELKVMSGLTGSMVDAYQFAMQVRDNGFEPWECRLKIASLVKLNVKLAGKVALSKKEIKASFTVFEIGGFMAALSDFKWDESDGFVLGFVARLKQEIEPKFC